MDGLRFKIEASFALLAAAVGLTWPQGGPLFVRTAFWITAIIFLGLAVRDWLKIRSDRAVTNPVADLLTRAQEYVDHVAGRLKYANEVCEGTKDVVTFSRKVPTQKIDMVRLINCDVSALSQFQKAAHERLAIASNELGSGPIKFLAD